MQLRAMSGEPSFRPINFGHNLRATVQNRGE